MSLTQTEARDLAKQVAKDAPGTLVKFGKTNGHIVLHVIVPGSNSQTRTIYSVAEWNDNPANERETRNKNFASDQPLETLISQNGTKNA